MFSVSQTELQHFVTKSVKDSVEFQQLCIAVLGEELNFYRGGNLLADNEVVPYFMSFKFNSHEAEGQDDEYILQFIISIDSGEEAPTVDADGISVYTSTDNVEKLALKAIEVMRDDLRSGGLNGICLLRLVDTNVLITEVGEAGTEVQAIVSLRFEEYSIL